MCNWSTAIEERGELNMIIRALEKRSEDEVKEILGVTDLEIQQARAKQNERKTLVNV